MRPELGLVFQPDEAFLEVTAPLYEEAIDYVEVAPETLWYEAEDGRLVENGFFGRVADLGLPVVAHGVGLSTGTAHRADAARRRRWLARIAEDHRRLRYRWYTDHLGTSAPAGLAIGLPLPLPMTPDAVRVVRRRLAALQRIVPDVGLENTAQYFFLGEAAGEPAFLRRILAGPRTHLLLDLHNVYTVAQNGGPPPERILEALDLARVIEVHVAGGSVSDPAWLPSGRTFRLDGHDGAVPEAVWRLAETIVPRCPNLRGLTLERMEGTVAPGDLPLLREELRRARRIVEAS